MSNIHLFVCLSSKLQALVLQRQTFLEKCDAWMSFLTQTEEKLAAEISGNYQSLLDQQREHEVLTDERLIGLRIDILTRTQLKAC